MEEVERRFPRPALCLRVRTERHQQPHRLHLAVANRKVECDWAGCDIAAPAEEPADDLRITLLNREMDGARELQTKYRICRSGPPLP
jgi:hypothetical protein